MAGGRVPVRLLFHGMTSVLTSVLGSLLASSVLTSCAHRVDRPYVDAPSEPPPVERVELGATPPESPTRHHVQMGYATWYGQRFAGRTTANGERFDPNAMTAAHRTLPFGTWVDVRRVDTGASVRVRITDRGPFGHEDRIIDLSRAAAQRIGIVKAGVGRVEVRVVAGP